NAFDRKEWRRAARELPERASRIPSSSAAFELLVLQRWTEAHRLHRAALKTRGKLSFHKLRIGIKRLRYSTECFLPALHQEWRNELKRLQDLLGKIHDLDVLGEMLTNLRPRIEPPELRMWGLAIHETRKPLLVSYRERTAREKSPWTVWRERLP